VSLQDIKLEEPRRKERMQSFIQMQQKLNSESKNTYINQSTSPVLIQSDKYVPLHRRKPRSISSIALKED